jgi:hypothetical protein
MCEVELVEDDPIKPISSLMIKMKTKGNKFLSQRHQIPQTKGWIGSKLQVHKSHLILMQTTAPTCQSSLKMKKTLLFPQRIQVQSSFGGITS